jgi:hypothetical protein
MSRCFDDAPVLNDPRNALALILSLPVFSVRKTVARSLLTVFASELRAGINGSAAVPLLRPASSSPLSSLI